MVKGDHLTTEGFSQILRIRNSMNKGRTHVEDDTIEDDSTFYMYNRDKTVLYYYTKDVKKFSEYLKIYKLTLLKHLTNETYYLGKYLFSKELSNNVLKWKNLSLSELNLMLTKDREKFTKKVKR